MRIRVVFLGTPEFAVPTLTELLSDEDKYEVVTVITQPERPAGRNLEAKKSRVNMVAEEHLSKKGRLAKKFPILTPENVNAPEVLKALKEYFCDVAVVVAYGQILSPQFLQFFPKGAVNVHASLLPRWRGAAPIPWALLNQDPVTGVTLQRIVQKLDAGDIVARTEVALNDSYDATKLYAELSRKGADLVRRFLPAYCEGQIKLEPQDETKVTYAGKITKEHGLVDWNETATRICSKIQALSPWPGVWTTREGKVLKILRAQSVQYSSEFKPGFVVTQDKVSFAVQCGSGSALQILVVQPESRSRLPVSEYLKGYPFKRGDFLGG